MTGVQTCALPIWYLLGEENNAKMQCFVKKLNQLYRQYDAFYYNDYNPEGFEWIDQHDAQRSIVAFVRKGSTKKDELLFVFNFTPVCREDYRVGVSCSGIYTEILNSDSVEFGGATTKSMLPLKSEEVPCNQWDKSIHFTLPPLSAVAFKFNETVDEEAAITEKPEKKSAAINTPAATEVSTETSVSAVSETAETAAPSNPAKNTSERKKEPKTYKSSTRRKGKRRK